jgi:hypothetical protein
MGASRRSHGMYIARQPGKTVTKTVRAIKGNGNLRDSFLGLCRGVVGGTDWTGLGLPVTGPTHS